MTGQWAYVIAAYALTMLLTLGVTLQSLSAMLRAEGRIDALRKPPE